MDHPVTMLYKFNLRSGSWRATNWMLRHRWGAPGDINGVLMAAVEEGRMDTLKTILDSDRINFLVNGHTMEDAIQLAKENKDHKIAAYISRKAVEMFGSVAATVVPSNNLSDGRIAAGRLSNLRRKRPRKTGP